MDCNNELKTIVIKNRMCYHFGDNIKLKLKLKENNLDSILIGEKSYENILVYNISYKNLIAKPLWIRFNKIDGFIRVYYIFSITWNWKIWFHLQ